MATAKDLLELLLANSAISIGIKHAEGALKILAGKEHVLLEGSRDELSVIDTTVTIDVCSTKHVSHIWLLKMENLRDILHSRLKLLESQETI